MCHFRRRTGPGAKTQSKCTWSPVFGGDREQKQGKTAPGPQKTTAPGPQNTTAPGPQKVVIWIETEILLSLGIGT